MRNIVLTTRAQPSKDEIKTFVSDQGGHWNVATGHSGVILEDGVIERGDAAVFVDYLADIRSELDPAEIESFRMAIGREPMVAVGIHIGHYGDSVGLAWELMDELVERFGGVVDATSLLNKNKTETRITPSGQTYKPEW